MDAHGNLTGELTGFVGRRAELALVRQSLARLVTLTGPGGIGKTRLALRTASAAQRAFRDGVWLTELAGLRDPALLAAELARSLGLSDQAATWGVTALSDHLAARQALLILDGCEHLTDGCAVLADALLRGCPERRILATSRHVLRVAGEVTIVVPPMSVPSEAGPCAPGGPGDLSRYEAVRLFADRAAAVLPEFVIDDGNGPVVAALCRRLDGIPLAIELATGRLRSLSPGQILARLDSGFELLSGGGPAQPPRHRALEGTLEWSYELLTGTERAAWRRVSVFARSFDLDAAEYVCAGDAAISPESVADLIDSLVAKSVLLRTAGQDEAAARYRLLDTIGAFGLRKLRAEGDERALRLRHFGWCAALAARPGAWGAGRARCARTLLETAIATARSGPDAPATAYASAYLGYVLFSGGETAAGRALLDAALTLHQESADAVGVAVTLLFDGFIRLFSGEPGEAAEWFADCARRCEQDGTVYFLGHARWGLAVAAWESADYAGASDFAAAGLRLAREIEDRINMAQCLEELGWIDVARRGAAMTPAEAVRFALGEAAPSGPPPAGPDGAPPVLTRHELDVAALVAQGLSNSQIAAALVISNRTAETHVAHIMTKLGFGTRSQIAAWSATGGEST